MSENLKAIDLFTNGLLKDYIECTDYIQKYFYPCTNGMHFMLVDNDFQCLTEEVVKKVYMNRLPKEISNWYFKKNTNLYTIINDVNKPRVEGNNLNMFKGFKHKRKAFSEYSNDLKKRVKQFIAFVGEVICDNNKNMLSYILLWLGVVAHGLKTQHCCI